MTDLTSRLLTPATLGRLALRNRFAVAPMTRVTATEEGLPTQAMHDYYLRFAKGGFGLVITEGLYTDRAFSQGYSCQPGLAEDVQAQAWIPTVQDIHGQGARVLCQIMHAGALGQHNRFRNHTVAPSAIRPTGQQLAVYYGHGPYEKPAEISEDEINEVIQGFVTAAARAVRIAGFDGVEIHAANGYLLHQFLSAETNQRTDRWGGSVHKRVSLLVEIIKAIKAEIGHEATVGIRISQAKVNDFASKWPGGEDDAEIIFSALAAAGVDFIHITEYVASRPAFDGAQDSLVALAHRYAPTVPLIANGGLEQLEQASAVLNAGAGVIALGKAALANPDFPHRVVSGLEQRPFDPAVLQPIANIKDTELAVDLITHP